MSLPTSGSINTDDIMAELRTINPSRAYPLSLDDADVLTLAGKSAPPVILPDDFYGKSVAQPGAPLTATAQGSNSQYDSSNSAGTATASGNVYPAGGSGGYSFAWAMVSNPGSATIGPLNGQSVNISKSFSKLSDGSVTVTFNVTVTDSQGHTYTVNNISVTAGWYSNR